MAHHTESHIHLGNQYNFDAPVRADSLYREQTDGLADTFFQVLSKTSYFSVGGDELRSPALTGSKSDPGPETFLRDTIKQSVTATTLDLFKYQEVLPKEGTTERQMWENIVVLSPQIVGIFLDAQQGISGVLDQNIGPLLRFSIAAVKDPELMSKALINQGVGGTDKQVPLRSLAYPVTMLETVKSLEGMYAAHAARAVLLEENIDPNNKPTKEQIKTAEIEARKKSHEALKLDADTLKKYGIPSKLPTAEVFSGAEAAAKGNGGTVPELIRYNSDLILDSSRALAEEYYPGVPFETRSLLPWKDKAENPTDETLSPFTELAIEYLAEQFKYASDPAVVKLRGDILRMAAKRHTEDDIVFLYPAVHPPTFGDDIKIALGEIFDTPRREDISAVFSYGAWPERIFDGIRQFMISNSSPEEQQRFLRRTTEQTKRRLTTSTEGIAKLDPKNLDFDKYEELKAEKQRAETRLAKLTPIQEAYDTEKELRQIEGRLQRRDLKDRDKVLARREELRQKAATLPTIPNINEGPLYGSIMLLLDHCENPPYYPIEPVAVTTASHISGNYEAVPELVVHKKSEKKGPDTVITLIGRSPLGESVYKKVVTQDNTTKTETYILQDETITVDIPLAGYDIRSPYELVRHIDYLASAVDRAKTASNSDKRLKGNSGLQVNIERMESALKDYKILYGAMRHRLYEPEAEDVEAAK